MKDSFALHRRAQDAIAQGYLTNSKRPQSHVKGVYPSHVKGGLGCKLFGHDGRSYTDFICGLGTNLLGYGNERIAAAMQAELRNGYCHSFATHHEVEAAEKLKELFPFVDAVKFLKTGSEACLAAVKIARASTGRARVLSAGYHGWGDEFVSLTPPAFGCSGRAYTYELGGGYEIDDETAAVIVEPVITDASDARRAWLQELRETCTKHGTLLIFDEVITGLRWPRFSVSAHWSITPDLIVLGKALGGGMPLAAVGGRYDVMNRGEYFISSTYAGETLSLVAAKTAMTLLQTKYDLAVLWEKGQAFLDQFNAIAPGLVRIDGYPTRGAFKGALLTKALFFQEMCEAGVLFGPSWFFSFPLAEESHGVLQACRDVLTRIANGQVTLRGELPSSPFAEQVRAGKS
ncbi:MAG: aminotransferase class III-fold pyridoxal phosphate-dependent enzyme [Pseudomonadota bacterium]